MKSIFIFGLAVVDFIHFVEELPRGGLKHLSLGAEVSGGGTGANAAVAVSRLGGQAILGSRLGDDLIAEIVLEGLRLESINTDYIQRTEKAMSPFSSVFVDKDGERQIVSFRGQGLSDQTEWLDDLPDVNLFLVDLRWPNGLERVLQVARQRGIPAVIDGERASHDESIWLASHLAFSKPGLQYLTGEEDILTALKSLTSNHPSNWFCVTDGDRGVYRAIGGKIEHIPAFEVAAKNTLGAGDVWHGSFALRLAEGVDEDTAILFANAAAAIKCTRNTSRASFPTRKEVDEFLAKSN